MLWFTLSLLTAIASTAEAGFLKRCLPDLSPFEAALYPLVYCAPFILCLVPFVSWSQDLSAQYWTTFAILLPVNAMGMTLYLRGVNLSPLSLTLPYLAFTPAFVLIPGYFILDEVPNVWGGAGVLLIVAGSYMLNIEARGTGGWLAPFRAIVSERGSRSALVAALLFGLAAVLGRKGILESDPLFFTVTFFGAQAVLVIIILPLAGLARLSSLTKHPRKGLIMGGLFFSHAILHTYAVSLVKTAYMISIKRLNAVFAVLVGGIWLGEAGMRTRLAGAALMFLGAAIIGVMGD